jgi:hypothetical protein
MSCETHNSHDHKHGSNCGHVAVKHEDHVDYVHDGHLHHVHSDHVDECKLSESAANPVACTPEHKCDGHDSSHKHGADCGHAAVPHGDHVDYLVNGHLHSPCGTHCDNHGTLAAA